MNVARRISRALREVADALDDIPEPTNDIPEPKRSSTRVRAVRRAPAPPPADVDDVTRARALRLLRTKGFIKGDK